MVKIIIWIYKNSGYLLLASLIDSMSTVQISNHKSLSSVRQKSPDGELIKNQIWKKNFKIKITEYTQCTQKYNQLLQH